MDIYVYTCAIIQYYFAFFGCSNYTTFGHWKLFLLALVFLTYPQQCFGGEVFVFHHCLTVLLFWHYKMLWAHVVYFLP